MFFSATGLFSVILWHMSALLPTTTLRNRLVRFTQSSQGIFIYFPITKKKHLKSIFRRHTIKYLVRRQYFCTLQCQLTSFKLHKQKKPYTICFLCTYFFRWYIPYIFNEVCSLWCCFNNTCLEAFTVTEIPLKKWMTDFPLLNSTT